MIEFIPLFMFLAVFVLLLAGYPVALTLGGVSLLLGLVGMAAGVFSAGDLGFLSGRIFQTITNQTLIAVPLFVLMGVTLEKSRVAEKLLESFSKVFGALPGGLGLAVTFVGMLMAASTGIVGATVVTMGLMSLPTMLRAGYDPRLATGTIAATGTLGQIIPPSIALVLLGDVLGSAYQTAQRRPDFVMSDSRATEICGEDATLVDGAVTCPGMQFAQDAVSVGDLFAGALIPGLVLVAMYGAYVFGRALLQPEMAPPARNDDELDRTRLIATALKGLVPPLLLIIAVLGSIIGGVATPTEASGVGALGAFVLAAFQRELNLARLKEIVESTARTTAMVFLILIGAAVFSLVFRGYGGDLLVEEFFASLPGGVVGAMVLVMVVVFLLGFILDFIEITFVVVPIVAPVMLAMGLDPIWLGVMLAVNLQTSFLTPPFGFALFYLRGVAPPVVKTTDIYRGVIPFIVLQLTLLALLAMVPELATWLPAELYGE